MSKDRFPHAKARAVVSVMSFYKCGQVGPFARDCRQRSNNELCGPRDHAELGRQGTTLDTRESGSATEAALCGPRGHAELGCQETTLDTRESGGATEAACGVQKRYWTRSGNRRQGPMRNQSCPQTRWR